MKRMITIALTVLLVTALLAGCSGNSAKITGLEDLEDKVIAMVAGPVPVEMAKAGIEGALGFDLKDLLYYDSMSGLVSALKTKKVDAVYWYDYAADYITDRNSDITYKFNYEGAAYNVHMAMRKDEEELLSTVNTALVTMKEDGTLELLSKTYITDLTADDQLVGKDLPKIDGAKTVYVGITGELPPLDYIAADGKPAGYNVEMLSILSERTGYNFEIVSMANEAKFTALAANKIDMFFFHLLSDSVEATTATAAANPNVTFSEPYFTFNGSGFLVLKNLKG